MELNAGEITDHS